MHTISDNDNLSPAVIDAYLTIVKQSNRKDVLLNKTVDKILGFSTSMSQRIIIEKKRSSVRVNLFRYDILLFPLKTNNFWILCVINFP